MRYITRIFILLIFTILCTNCSSLKGNEDENDLNIELCLSTNELFLESEEIIIDTINITSNTEWVITNDSEDWCEVTPLYGSGDSEILIFISENITLDNREAVITFSAGNKAEKLTITQYGAIISEYQDIDWNNTLITDFNAANGTITFTVLDGANTTFDSNQAIVLPETYDYEVRVVESSSFSGNNVTLNTSQGNISNLFQDIDFTLMTNETKAVSATRSNGERIVTPSEIGIRTKDGEYKKVYSKSDAATRGDFSYTENIISLGNDYSGTTIFEDDVLSGEFEKGVFDIGLDAIFEFSFSREFNNERQFIGALDDFKFYIDGNIDIDLLAKYIIKGGCVFGTDTDDVDYIKENIIDDIILKFMVGNVPVYVVVSTHLCKIATLEANAEATFSAGCYLNSTAQIGLHYSNGSTTPFTSFNLDYGVYDPTFSISGSIEATASIYPKFDFSIYNILGPWVEPMPYIKEKIEATMQVSNSGDEDYAGWTANCYSGMMYRVGLELGFFSFSSEVYKSDIMDVDSKLLLEAPSKIELSSPIGNIDIKKGEVYDVIFNTYFHNLITEDYIPCSGVIVRIDNSDILLVSDLNGTVTTQWAPDSNSDTFDAEIIGHNGETISTAVFPESNDRANVCVVTFYSNGGSLIESLDVEYDTPVDMPIDPTKDNCIFEGWYSDANYNAKWDFNNVIIEDITLYAKWIEINMTISSVEELKLFRDLVNMGYGKINATLLTSLDVNDEEWTPIGSSANFPYQGVFDGGGNTIYNLMIDGKNEYQGLFGYLSDGVISNIILVDCQIKSTSSYIGAICGRSQNGYIDNCCVQSGSIISSLGNVGGIVGSVNIVNSDDIEYFVTNCENNGEVSGYSSIGGIAGSGDTENCTNNGDVLAYGECIGGLTGIGYATNCTNTGTVSGSYYVGGAVGNGNAESCSNNNTISGGGCVGGLAGTGNAVNSSNTGDILGKSYIGGIIGKSISNYTIENCENNGNVYGTGEEIGGIVGLSYSESIINCSNTGKISADEGYAGGIAGYTTNSDIDKCTNSGDVEGQSVLGGIVGKIVYASINESDNKGDITGESGHGSAGGIVGYGESFQATSCNNSGTIFISRNIGGIIGYFRPYGSGYLKSCNNNGTVTKDGITYYSSIYGGIDLPYNTLISDIVIDCSY